MKKSLALLFALALLLSSCSHQHYTYLRAAEERETVTAAQREEYAAFVWRFERRDREALPDNFRTCRNEFKQRSAVPGYDPEFVPTRKGLDELKISASSDFSAGELDAAIAEIRKYHDGPITVVDLRKETHGLLNGNHVSRFGKQNWDNIGLSREEIIAAEKEIIHGTVGTQVETGSTRPGGRTSTMDVTTAQTEEELCASRGIGYFRLTVLDHCFSDPESIDAFIAFVRTLPEDTWLHFHCQAGMGRTNMYLIFYDFLRNPDVPEKDIVYRHFNQGGNFMYYQGDKPNEEAYKVPLAKEKAEMIPLVRQYIQEQQPKGFKLSWTQWKARRR
jgi:hypothetical protein